MLSLTATHSIWVSSNAQRLILRDSPYKGLILLALPIILANLLKALHDLIDTVFLGSVQSSVSAQAAVAISSPIIIAVIALPLGLSLGMTALISNKLGSGDRKGATRLAGNGALIGIVLAAALTAFMFFACPHIVSLLASGDTRLFAAQYVRIRALEMPAVVAFEVFRGLRAAQGETRVPVVYMSLSLALNVALTALFIHFGWGIVGAAIATAVAQWSVAPFCVVGIFKSKKYLTAQVRGLKPQPDCIKPLIKMSLPPALSGALASVGFLVLQIFIRTYGDATIAAFSICNRITNILTVPVSALGSILTTFIGQNVGAGDNARAFASYKAARNYAAGLMTVCALAMMLCRKFLIGIMTGDQQVELIANEYIVWLLATLPLMGLFQNYCGAYNGYGRTGFTFVLECARLWALRLPLLLIFLYLTNLGRSGIWYAMMASNILICILGHILLKKAVINQ